MKMQAELPAPAPRKPVSDYRSVHEKDVLARLRKIEGQVHGLVSMIESGRPCEDIAVQMTAARKALDKAFYRMMICSIIEAANSSGSSQQSLAEIENAAHLMEKLA